MAPEELGSLNDRLAAAYSSYADRAAPAAPAPEAPEPEGPGYLESLGRGALQGATFGFSDEITGALESAFSKKTYQQARDESRAANRKASEANPITYGIGDILGSIAPTVATAGLGEAATGARLASTAAKAAVEGAAQGAASGAGYSEESGIGGILADAAKGAAIGGATGAVGGKLTEKAIEAAPARAVKTFVRETTEGAHPAFKRRFIGDAGALARGEEGSYAQTAKDVLEKDPEIMFAIGKKSEQIKAADIAGERVKTLSGETKPIYQELDDKAGLVPLKDVAGYIDSEIARLRTVHGGADVADVLAEVKGNFVKSELAKNPQLVEMMGNPGTTDEAVKAMGDIGVSHQDLRQWVTSLLEHKTRVLPGASETEAFKLSAAAHDVADSFLRQHLDDVAAQVPELAPQVDRLRALNQQIAVYSSAKALFANKAANALTKSTNFLDSLSAQHGQLAGVLGFITGGASHAAGALGAGKAIEIGGKIARHVDKKITNALAQVANEARRGDVSAQKILGAIKLGVPATAIAGVLGLYRRAMPEGVDTGTEE